jgi:hypothetical protein
VGALEVISPTNDASTIWQDAYFPVRFAKLARKPYNLFKAERLKGKTAITAEVTVPEPEAEIDEQAAVQYAPIEDIARSVT